MGLMRVYTIADTHTHTRALPRARRIEFLTHLLVEHRLGLTTVPLLLSVVPPLQAMAVE